MGVDKTNITNQHGFERSLRNTTNKNWRNIFGMALNAIFKPFTTFVSATGVPNYSNDVWGSGLIANSSGLNPYGPSTVFEGIVHGHNKPTDLNSSIDPNTVRAHGIKTPVTYVGWGFDTFGYPAPNSNESWNTSGVRSATGPDSMFGTSGDLAVSYGSHVAQTVWRAGPQDLRWDNNRKVWSAPVSVYAGYILRAYSSGTSITNYGTPLEAASITYDAQFFDGIANQIVVTGARFVGPRPTSGAYKVLPFSSGDFTFIVHAMVNGKPGFGIWNFEEPGVVICNTTSSTGTGGGTSQLSQDPYQSSTYSYLSKNGLVGSPLEKEYGGTGFDDYPAYKILMGSPSGDGNLNQYTLSAGTGITIEVTGTTLSVKFSSGVSFNSAGINTTITELQGLSTPLSLGQGGTGASGKNFVDLGTTQNVSGIKNFTNSIRLASGLYTSPSLAFNNETRTGFYLLSTKTGIGMASSGMNILEVSFNGSNLYSHLNIEPSTLPVEYSGNNSYAPLMVNAYPDFNANNSLQIWFDKYGTGVASVDSLGRSIFVGSVIRNVKPFDPSPISTGHLIDIQIINSFEGDIIRASGSSGPVLGISSSGNTIFFGPSGQQTTIISNSGNRTINLASGYNGNIDVKHPTTGSIRTLHIMHGLITGYTDS